MSKFENHEMNAPYGAFLPKEAKKKPRSKARLWVYGFLFLMFVHQVFMVSRLESSSDGLMLLIKNIALFLSFLFFVLLSLPFHTVAHELGHALAGLSRGMRIVLLSFGKWRYERTVKGFRWRKSFPIQGIAGVAALMIDTTNPRKYTRFDFIIFLAAGVFVNLILGLGAYLIFANLIVSNAFNLVLKSALGAFSFTGLFLGVFNLLPLKVNGWYVDGRLIWCTLKGEGWELNRRNLYLGSLLLAGTPARLLPQNDLPTLEELEDEKCPLPFKMSAYQLRLMFALDAGDRAMAEQSAAWLAEHFYQLPDGLRQSVALQMAFFSVHFLHNKEVFNAWRPLCEGGLYNLNVSKYMLDAEYACLCGDREAVRKSIQKARGAFLELPTQAHIDEAEEKLLRLEEVCKEN
ncbi:MAG: M50 family metallopeptidase [Saezia sp.]